MCRVCRDAGVTIALAGSLGRSLIRTLKPTAPDWFAVRGAACEGLHRTAAVDAEQGARPGRSLGTGHGRHSRKLTARTRKDGAGRPQRPREPFIDEAALRRLFPIHPFGNRHGLEQDQMLRPGDDGDAGGDGIAGDGPAVRQGGLWIGAIVPDGEREGV